MTEAKKDDFEKGAAQCVAEMVVCRETNTTDGHFIDVHGIVSNGQGWEFYKLSTDGKIYSTGTYAITALPQLLGVLNYVCSECSKNVPPPKGSQPANRLDEHRGLTVS